MKGIMQRNFTMLEGQRTQANQELVAYGYQLTKGDMQRLYQTLSKTCIKYAMVETDAAILFRFIHCFQDGNYAKEDAFLRLLEAVMDIYYAVRSVFPINFSDQDILDIMRIMYERNHGYMNEETRRMVMQDLKGRMHHV